ADRRHAAHRRGLRLVRADQPGRLVRGRRARSLAGGERGLRPVPGPGGVHRHRRRRPRGEWRSLCAAERLSADWRISGPGGAGYCGTGPHRRRTLTGGADPRLLLWSGARRRVAAHRRRPGRHRHPTQAIPGRASAQHDRPGKELTSMTSAALRPARLLTWSGLVLTLAVAALPLVAPALLADQVHAGYPDY